jgi:raffinose/stachyose/melibiose transport system permease protein
MKKKNKYNWNKKDKIFLAITIIPLALYILLFMVPVFMGFNYSLTDWNGLSSKYNFVGLSNYVTIFTKKRYMKSLLFTFKYSFFLVVGVMVLAMVITLALTYLVSKKFATFYRSIFFFPAVLSLITVGLVWSQIFYRVLPIIGQALNIGWMSKNILGDPNTAMWGVLLVNIWQGTAIPFVILLAGIQNVPQDLSEAARIDGANSFQIFTKITVPFMLPTINVAFVMVLKSGITVFDYIQAMTEGGPMQSTESAGYLIYQLAFSDNKAGLSTAYAVILLLIVAIISIIQMVVSSKFEVGQV